MLTVLSILGVAVILAWFLRSKEDKEPSGPDWRIGPIVNGKNYSQGMPKTPIPYEDGWFFNFSINPDQHVHYVQLFNPPHLDTKKTITIKFSVTGGPFIAQEYPTRTALVSLVLQRSGDDWSEKKEAYRWFSKAFVPLEAGAYSFSVALTGTEWKSTLGLGTEKDFLQTLESLDNIGIVFGSAGGRGHGVYAKNASKFILNSFEVT